jgi:site-specific DNA-methyltransferase (adenine-specific)
MKLKALEEQLASSISRLNLRPSLNQAADIGDLLLAAKLLLGHGKYLPWLKKMGVHKRTASDYTTIAIHRSKSKERLDSHLTLKQFFEILRTTRRKSLKSLREEERIEIANLPGTPPPSLTLAHADCKTFKFPKNLDCITADPPWNDMEAYKWLDGFASSHLKPGGLLLVQCGTAHLDKVFALLPSLNYLWTFAMVLPRIGTIIPGENIQFVAFWRPVIVLSKGQREKGQSPMDVVQVKSEDEDGKQWHEWQQPLKPWRYWLSCFLKPGELIADPFAGSATIGAVSHELQLRYIGTEIDQQNYRVARARLAAL